MILGPLPLLRKVVRSGEKSHEIVPVSPGEPFKIFPYTFCLLKTGDIFVNRYREKGRLKVSVKWVFIPSVAIVLAFLSIYHFSTALKIEGRESAATLNHTIEKKGHTPGSDKGISRKMLESTGDHQNTPEKIRIYNLKRIEDGDHPKNRGAILSRPNNRKDLSTISSEKKRVSDKPGIPPGEFEMHIQAASESIALGNPQEAGRTINPVLRHLSLEQESRLIQRLEPGMNSLFRKAYMLMEYDRAAARVTLEKIVRSGLRQLPSFEKARAILEAERKAEAVYGNATGTEND